VNELFSSAYTLLTVCCSIYVICCSNCD